MNFFLLMYLNMVRGPRIQREKAEQEERERLAQEEEDRKNGVVRPAPTCKKCDAKLERKAAGRTATLCEPCQAKDLAERQAQMDQFNQELKMSPFLWFQCFVVLLGLSVFIHRNVFAFF